MMEFRAVDGTHRVAMRIDMDEAERAFGAERLQDREGYRMVAANRYRAHPGLADALVKERDILDRLVEAVARAHRHIADIGDIAQRARGDFERVIIGADTLDIAHRARAKARARPVGDAKVHRHADNATSRPAKSAESAASGRYGSSSRVGTPANGIGRR